jgi:competence protein ComEC
MTAIFIIILISYKKDKAFRPILVILVFFLSIAYFSFRSGEDLGGNHLIHYVDDEIHTIEGVVVRPVTLKEWDKKDFVLSVKTVSVDGHPMAAHGKLLLRTKNITEKIGYGDLVSFKGKLRLPTNFNNPGAFDYVGYLKAKGIHVTSNIYKNKRLLSVKRGYEKGVFYYLQKVRERANDFIYEKGLSNNKRVVSALLFGGTRQINAYVHKLFISTGTSHILAISGLHMGVISIFFYYTTLFFLKRSERFALEHNIIKLSYLITLIFLIIYSLLVGMRVSSVRAVIMIGVYILSVLFDRAQNTLRTMFVAAFIILFVYPSSLYDVSFLLSFSAVFAILYFYPKLNLKIDKYFEAKSDQYFKKRTSAMSIVKSSVLVFTLSVVINIIVLPIILYNFNYVSLLAPLLNAIVIPIYSILVIPVNFLVLLFSFILPSLGEALLHINEYIIYLTILLLKFLDRHLNVPLYTATPAALEMIFYYGLVFSIFNIRGKRFKVSAVIFASLLVMAGAYYKLKPFSEKNLTVDFIDVSQGESMLITFPNGENMLIDGGGFYKTSRFDAGKDVVAKFLWKQKITKLNYIVSTHPHPDHMNGLFFVASRFSPDRIFVGKYDYISKMNDRFIKRFSDNIEYVGEENSELKVGESIVRFFNYDYKGPLKSNTDVNRSSLVVMLEHQKKRILFTSDIDFKIEEELIKKGVDLKCDILKVGHHGSKTSSSKRFIDAASPEYAVISVGKYNFFHLPSDTALNILKEKGIKIYRTDEAGMVSVVIDNKNITIKPFINKI